MRPARVPHQKSSEWLTIRCTPDERLKVERAARREKLPASVWARGIVLEALGATKRTSEAAAQAPAGLEAAQVE